MLDRNPILDKITIIGFAGSEANLVFFVPATFDECRGNVLLDRMVFLSTMWKLGKVAKDVENIIQFCVMREM